MSPCNPAVTISVHVQKTNGNPEALCQCPGYDCESSVIVKKKNEKKMKDHINSFTLLLPLLTACALSDQFDSLTGDLCDVIDVVVAVVIFSCKRKDFSVI